MRASFGPATHPTAACVTTHGEQRSAQLAEHCLQLAACLLSRLLPHLILPVAGTPA